MLRQQSTEEETNQAEGIVVPLAVARLWIIKQELRDDGTIRVEVIGTNNRRVADIPVE